MNEDSEYHTASEFVPDFESDNEPPEDKEHEKKLFHKTKNLRLYKRILRLPKKSLDLPAKCDRVNIRYMRFDFEQLTTKDLLESPILEWQLGVTSCPKSIEVAISSMKRGEISIFEDENVIFDMQTNERKLDKKEYFMLELIDYITIIDLFGDQKMFKILIEKGVGINRLSNCDKIKANVELFDDKAQIIWKLDQKEEIEVQLLVHEITKSEKLKNILIVQKMMLSAFQTVKNHEKCYFEFKFDENEQIESNETSKVVLFENGQIKYETIPKKCYLKVEIIDNYRYEDIFNDGSILKRTIKTGCSTASPEMLSLIYFDIKIKVNDQKIYSSLLKSISEKVQRCLYRRIIRRFLHSKLNQ